MNETWQPLPNTKYQISSSGLVKSPSGQILQGQITAKGYRRFTIYESGVASSRSGHSLVMEAFVGPRPKGMIIRHIDGNPTNNRLSNLQYGTHSQNESDKRTHGTTLLGEKHHRCKIPFSTVKEIRASSESLRSIAKRFNINKRYVITLRQGKGRQYA
jgi:hypothetical protein